jgi:hypothetical protein
MREHKIPLIPQKPTAAAFSVAAIARDVDRTHGRGALNAYPSNPSNFDGGGGVLMPESLSRPLGVKPNDRAFYSGAGVACSA